MSTSATRSRPHQDISVCLRCGRKCRLSECSAIPSRPYLPKNYYGHRPRPANTRVRDYADIYTLTRNWPVDHGIAREALLATSAFRGTTLAALSSTVDNLADLRQQTKAAYRANLGTAGEDLPASFSEAVEAVIAFADMLASEASAGTTWSPQQRQWTRTDF